MAGSPSTIRQATRPSRRAPAAHGQLALLAADEPVWRLDAHTREVGRRGVAAAREILRRSAGANGDQDASQAA